MPGNGSAARLLLCALSASLSVAQQGAPLSPLNGTLLFDSGGQSLRNCSCAVDVQDCNDAMANLKCNCSTVPRSALPPTGLEVQGGLTVWVRDAWVLRELLNGSVVQDLRLAACNPAPFPAQLLALIGLRRLRLHSASQGATHPEQSLDISPGLGHSIVSAGNSSSSLIFPLQVSFLDVALLNGLSPLKAYSVSSPPPPVLAQHFPHLSLPNAIPTNQSPDPSHDCLLTFIY